MKLSEKIKVGLAAIAGIAMLLLPWIGNSKQTDKPKTHTEYFQEYSQPIKDAWAKWTPYYNGIMTESNKVIGLSFDGQSMGPAMSHKKAAWQHARLNFLLGRYYENPCAKNEQAFVNQVSEFLADAPKK